MVGNLWVNACGTEAFGKRIVEAVTVKLKLNVEGEHSHLTFMSVFSILVASIHPK